MALGPGHVLAPLSSLGTSTVRARRDATHGSKVVLKCQSYCSERSKDSSSAVTARQPLR